MAGEKEGAKKNFKVCIRQDSPNRAPPTQLSCNDRLREIYGIYDPCIILVLSTFVKEQETFFLTVPK